MNKQKSFTLIELLVVIVIIGILAGVIIISTSSSIDKANIAKVKVFEESITNSLAANMVSRWKLDEGSGTTTTDVWGANNGNLVNFNFDNNSGWVNENECVSGKCLKFDGIDDYISIGSLAIGNDLTITVWVNILNFENDRDETILASSSSGGRKFDFNDAIQLRYYDVDLSPQPAVYNISSSDYLNKWRLLTVSRINNLTSLFVDGRRVLSSYTQSNLSTIPFTSIGMAGSTRYFHGMVDDLKIYNSALSLNQIRQNYTAGLNFLVNKNLISKDEYNERISQLTYEK